MKKLVSVFALTVVAAMFITGCLGKEKCDLCGEMRFCDTYERLIDGKEVTYCEPCAEKIQKEAAKALEELADILEAAEDYED